MSKKRIGIAVMALGTLLWAAAAHASPEAPRLLSPPMALPVPSGFLKGAFAADFFCAFGVGQCALGFGDPVGRRSAGFGFGQKRRGGLHAQGAGSCRELWRRSFSLFAGAVRAFPVPQHRAYGRVVDVRRLVRHAGVLRALRERRSGQAGAADPDTVPVRAAASDDGLSAEQRKYPDAAPGLLVPVVLRAARASFEHKRSHLIPALSAYFTGFSGCGRPDDGLARPVEQARSGSGQGRGRAPFPPGAGLVFLRFLGAGSGGGAVPVHIAPGCARPFSGRRRAVHGGP